MRTVLALIVSSAMAASSCADTNRVHVAEAAPVSGAESYAYGCDEIPLAMPYEPDVLTRGYTVVNVSESFAVPKWYIQWTYDTGTTLWGIMRLARWYASNGDDRKVSELHDMFIRTLGEIESMSPERQREMAHTIE